MLKFFRRIRQKLLDEGQLKKYLVYAIGEILLVMIGILLALQINNCNEARKNKITERELLKAILANLEEDAVTLKRATERFNLTLKNINRLFDPLPIPDDSLAYISTRANGFSLFIPITPAFDRSMSSGEFQLIREDSIAKTIQRLYAFDYNSFHRIHDNLIKHSDEMRGFTRKHKALNLQPIHRKEGVYDLDYVLPFNIENLKRRNQDPEFKAFLVETNIPISIIITFYKTLQQKNEAVRNALTDYLYAF